MNSIHALLACLLLSLPFGSARASESYRYPVQNPFIATIAGTPSALIPVLPDAANIRQKDYSLNLRPEREHSLPASFRPAKRFKYRLARQQTTAPLVFIIAGTAARYDAAGMEFLKKLLYGAGYHVVQLSSPTSYDFMISSSKYATPGFSPLDAAELYAVMQRLRQRHDDLAISSWHLAGYSLGALHAGFVSELDSREHAFGFQRTLLINPPVNLLTSVSNLDKMATVDISDVPAGDSFYQSVLERLARFFERKGRFDLNEAMLFEFQQSAEGLNNEQLALLIASVFRLAAADISFVSDQLNRRGLFGEPNKHIGYGTSLTPGFELALLCDFNCYLHEQLLPFWQQRYQPGGNMQQLVHATSLVAIEQHLRTNGNLAVLHNADDIILGPGDLEYLHNVLGKRLRLYPQGGHLGNMMYQDNASDILEFFNVDP